MALPNMLADLPSRGLLTAVQPGSAFSKTPRLYIADHDTSPRQVVSSNPTAFLLRALSSRKDKQEARKRAEKPMADRGKRPAEGADAPRMSKRAATAVGCTNGAGPSSAEPEHPQPSQAEYSRSMLQSRTIKELQSILRSWRLTTSGRKDDLVNRILTEQATAQRT